MDEVERSARVKSYSRMLSRQNRLGQAKREAVRVRARQARRNILQLDGQSASASNSSTAASSLKTSPREAKAAKVARRRRMSTMGRQRAWLLQAAQWRKYLFPTPGDEQGEQGEDALVRRRDELERILVERLQLTEELRAAQVPAILEIPELPEEFAEELLYSAMRKQQYTEDGGDVDPVSTSQHVEDDSNQPEPVIAEEPPTVSEEPTKKKTKKKKRRRRGVGPPRLRTSERSRVRARGNLHIASQYSANNSPRAQRRPRPRPGSRPRARSKVVGGGGALTRSKSTPSGSSDVVHRKRPVSRLSKSKSVYAKPTRPRSRSRTRPRSRSASPQRPPFRAATRQASRHESLSGRQYSRDFLWKKGSLRKALPAGYISKGVYEPETLLEEPPDVPELEMRQKVGSHTSMLRSMFDSVDNGRGHVNEEEFAALLARTLVVEPTEEDVAVWGAKLVSQETPDSHTWSQADLANMGAAGPLVSQSVLEELREGAAREFTPADVVHLQGRTLPLPQDLIDVVVSSAHPADGHFSRADFERAVQTLCRVPIVNVNPVLASAASDAAPAQQSAYFDNTGDLSFDDLTADDSDAEQQTMTKAAFLRYFKLPGQLGDRLFAVLDRKRAGYISGTDFNAALQRFSLASNEERIATLFSMYDLNGDGVVDRDELKTMLESMLTLMAELDEGEGDGDGDIEEKAAFMVDEAFASCDVNNDGLLQVTEFKSWLRDTPDIVSALERMFSMLETTDNNERLEQVENHRRRNAHKPKPKPAPKPKPKPKPMLRAQSRRHTTTVVRPEGAQTARVLQRHASVDVLPSLPRRPKSARGGYMAPTISSVLKDHRISDSFTPREPLTRSSVDTGIASGILRKPSVSSRIWISSTTAEGHATTLEGVAEDDEDDEEKAEEVDDSPAPTPALLTIPQQQDVRRMSSHDLVEELAMISGRSPRERRETHLEERGKQIVSTLERRLSSNRPEDFQLSDDDNGDSDAPQWGSRYEELKKKLLRSQTEYEMLMASMDDKSGQSAEANPADEDDGDHTEKEDDVMSEVSTVKYASRVMKDHEAIAKMIKAIKTPDQSSGEELDDISSLDSDNWDDDFDDDITELWPEPPTKPTGPTLIRGLAPRRQSHKDVPVLSIAKLEEITAQDFSDADFDDWTDDSATMSESASGGEGADDSDIENTTAFEPQPPKLTYEEFLQMHEQINAEAHQARLRELEETVAKSMEAATSGALQQISSVLQQQQPGAQVGEPDHPLSNEAGAPPTVPDAERRSCEACRSCGVCTIM